jgi:Ni,Fe-hydrogenase maturation factor
VVVVGCEPATVEPDHDGRMDLSPAVDAAADTAIDLILAQLATIYDLAAPPH